MCYEISVYVEINVHVYQNNYMCVYQKTCSCAARKNAHVFQEKCLCILRKIFMYLFPKTKIKNKKEEK